MTGVPAPNLQFFPADVPEKKSATPDRFIGRCRRGRLYEAFFGRHEGSSEVISRNRRQICLPTLTKRQKLPRSCDVSRYRTSCGRCATLDEKVGHIPEFHWTSASPAGGAGSGTGVFARSQDQGARDPQGDARSFQGKKTDLAVVTLPL